MSLADEMQNIKGEISDEELERREEIEQMNNYVDTDMDVRIIDNESESESEQSETESEQSESTTSVTMIDNPQDEPENEVDKRDVEEPAPAKAEPAESTFTQVAPIVVPTVISTTGTAFVLEPKVVKKAAAKPASKKDNITPEQAIEKLLSDRNMSKENRMYMICNDICGISFAKIAKLFQINPANRMQQSIRGDRPFNDELAGKIVEHLRSQPIVQAHPEIAKMITIDAIVTHKPKATK